MTSAHLGLINISNSISDQVPVLRIRNFRGRTSPMVCVENMKQVNFTPKINLVTGIKFRCKNMSLLRLIYVATRCLEVQAKISVTNIKLPYPTLPLEKVAKRKY